MLLSLFRVIIYYIYYRFINIFFVQLVIQNLNENLELLILLRIYIFQILLVNYICTI